MTNAAVHALLRKAIAEADEQIAAEQVVITMREKALNRRKDALAGLKWERRMWAESLAEATENEDTNREGQTDGN